MTVMIVEEGDVVDVAQVGTLDLARYGWDWIIVQAHDEDEARAQAALYDRNAHPAQIEMLLFREMVQGLVASGEDEQAARLIQTSIDAQ